MARLAVDTEKNARAGLPERLWSETESRLNEDSDSLLAQNLLCLFNSLRFVNQQTQSRMRGLCRRGQDFLKRNATTLSIVAIACRQVWHSISEERDKNSVVTSRALLHFAYLAADHAAKIWPDNVMMRFTRGCMAADLAPYFEPHDLPTAYRYRYEALCDMSAVLEHKVDEVTALYAEGVLIILKSRLSTD